MLELNPAGFFWSENQAHISVYLILSYSQAQAEKPTIHSHPREQVFVKVIHVGIFQASQMHIATQNQPPKSSSQTPPQPTS
jgi:hypothetical protein